MIVGDLLVWQRQGEGCALLDHEVVLDQVKKVVLMEVKQLIFVLLWKNHQGHIAVRHAQKIFEIDPLMILVIKTVSKLQIKLLVFFIYILYVVAEQVDSLFA